MSEGVIIIDRIITTIGITIQTIDTFRSQIAYIVRRNKSSSFCIVISRSYIV